MKIFKEISRCRAAAERIKRKGLTLGLVPTMGYLHEGHISLVRAAKAQCNKVLMTIFVNPAQFGPGEDLDKYPRDIKRDAALAEKNGVDYLFNPEVEEMYKKGHGTYVEVGNLAEMMCGAYRPGHFKGVATVVLKLFNIIPAHRAYFGRKDFQQAAVIKKMVRDLDLDIEIVECPTFREEDGLALSSRNKYLNPQERENATIIYNVLKYAEDKINSGEEDLRKVRQAAIKKLERNPFVKKIDYFDIRDAETLAELESKNPDNDIVIATAVKIGGTRLIDNVVISKKKL